MSLACFYVENGVRGFDDFSQRLLRAFGEPARPYIRGLYEWVRRWPGHENAAAEMWSAAQVDEYIQSGNARTEAREDSAAPRNQVRQLIKKALETPTPNGLHDFLSFATKFRRLAVWNTQMARIQRPGARVLASEYEWKTVGRYVLPDAVPIIILWPFSPIRFIYEFADTGPALHREDYDDPFAVEGVLRDRTVEKLLSNLRHQKTFRVIVEMRREGFGRAGSAISLPHPDLFSPAPRSPLDTMSTGQIAHASAKSSGSGLSDTPSFRIVLNDTLLRKEQFVTLAHELGHIFCGHLGGCTIGGREQDESGWPDRRHLGNHEQEIEAEAVAYILAARAGLIARSADYLREHARKANLKNVSEDLIVRAASRIERLAEIHYGAMLFKAPGG